MEVMVQNSSSMDNFEFSGTMSSPYLSAPSSPKRFGEYYLSAPTSPSRVSELYADFHEYFSTTIHDASSSSSSSAMHFQQGMTTNNNEDDGDGEDDDEGFAFFVSRESEKPSRSAEELFDGGKIKLLEPKGNELFIKTHEKEEEEKERNILFKAFSKTKEANESHQETQQRRGRDRTPASSSTLSSSNSGRRITRSHSPYRTPFQEQQQPPLTNKLESSSILASSSSSSNNNNKGGSSSKRWSIKDLLLFRSASEGRASTKDQFKNILHNKSINKTSSFRSIDSSSRKKGHVSPHELHYAMKRAESEDMRKKTYLPYKHGILGRLAGFGL